MKSRPVLRQQFDSVGDVLLLPEPDLDQLFNILEIPQYRYGRAQPTPTVSEAIGAG